MTIIVAATDEQWIELTTDRTQVDWQRVTSGKEFYDNNNADAFFSLADSSELSLFESLGKPVLINSVIDTLVELNAPANVLRINGWATFLNRSVWEIAGPVDEKVNEIFETVDIKINKVTDEPGFISARIIAMIINEAYFAVEDNVSSKAEIDTAMKLGTNYPFGPFEWAALIGEKHISALLQKLYLADSRYQPASLLLAEVNK